MSLTASEMTPADIAAVTNGNGGYGDGFGGGNGIWWIIVLFLIAAMFGWGGNGFGNGGATPYVVNNDVQRGFDQASIMGALGDITGVVTNGFANAEVSRCNANTNLLQTLNSMQMSQQQCCCDTRASIADLKYTVATENCADRYEAAQNTRDIIESANRNNQAILDKLCQLELDAKNDRIAELERQLTMANLSASQTAQTSRLLADNTAQTVALEQYLNPTPVPAYIVQNPNCCNWNGGCGMNG